MTEILVHNINYIYIYASHKIRCIKCKMKINKHLRIMHIQTKHFKQNLKQKNLFLMALYNM